MLSTLHNEQHKRYALVGLVILWLGLGTLGHSPWKPDEAAQFGLALSVWRDGQWWWPSLAGEPFSDYPPLFAWTQALFMSLFGGLLGLADAARVAALFYTGLSFYAMAQAARHLYGVRQARVAVLMLMSSLVLCYRSHQGINETAVLCGYALCLAGLSQLGAGNRQAKIMWLLGMLILCASHSVQAAILMCTVPLALGTTQSPAEASATQSAPSLAQWQSRLAALLIFGGLVLTRQQLSWHGVWYFVQFVFWATLPAWPLAAWSVYLMRRGFLGGFSAHGFRLPVCFFLIVFGWLILTAEPYDVNGLPLLLPLVLLAVPGIEYLKREHSGLLDWVGIALFAALIIAAWVYWSALYFGWPRGPLKTLTGRIAPGYLEPVVWWRVALALVFTTAWIVVIRPARRANHRAIVNWAMGITAAWGVATTLFMPYLEYANGYGKLLTELAPHLPRNACVASRNVGDNQRALLDFHLRLHTEREERTPQHQCQWLLQLGKAEQLKAFATLDSSWQLRWQGSRPGDSNEPWQLFQKVR
jgi:4-amino-4-deoxy-L-arabinose transferase-like glycosyltransferase